MKLHLELEKNKIKIPTQISSQSHMKQADRRHKN